MVDLDWMRRRAAEVGLVITDEDLGAIMFQLNKMRAAFARASYLDLSKTDMPVILEPGDDGGPTGR